MDRGAIRTPRLLLRPLRPEDAEPIARWIADWEVIRWLTRPPFPYTLDHAREFLSRAAGSPEHWAITREGTFLGVVTLAAQLGYWLGRPWHGQGCMTEAAAGVLAQHFAGGGGSVVSGYLPGNDASAGVLTKLGFVPTRIEREWSAPLGREVEVQRMVLDPPQQGVPLTR